MEEYAVVLQDVFAKENALNLFRGGYEYMDAR